MDGQLIETPSIEDESLSLEARKSQLKQAAIANIERQEQSLRSRKPSYLRETASTTSTSQFKSRSNVLKQRSMSMRTSKLDLQESNSPMNRHRATKNGVAIPDPSGKLIEGQLEQNVGTLVKQERLQKQRVRRNAFRRKQ